MHLYIKYADADEIMRGIERAFKEYEKASSAGYLR